jgi:hypothetical protein
VLKELQNNYDTLLHKFAAAENALGRFYFKLLCTVSCDVVSFFVQRKKLRKYDCQTVPVQR